ncbi:MAG: glycoside hydrolase family 99-like domain-containing protein [Proteobacteria bacterium]|nr:glycoside hydrolase family 99-like domain-containing protein [Pseudomonadota bacterium]
MQPAKIIAFHLTQFHPIPENDEWWGEGFTEWTNVLRGRPVYPRHRQPQLPGEMGFYDLRDESARTAQAELAKRFGIDGFCYYYYWFGGKRLLEQPVEAMLEGGAPDLPFCLCWANENWTRRWDGKDHEVLIGQNHSPEDDIAMIRDLIRHFRDPRYIRVDGKPMLIVYRTELLPDSVATVKRWREECRRVGIGEIYLCVIRRRFDMPAETTAGFDAIVDFPPNGHVATELAKGIRGVATEFAGRIFDYRDLIRDAMDRLGQSRTPIPIFPGVTPCWDNSARKGPAAHIYHGASPLLYRAWLAETIRSATRKSHRVEPFVFVNAWNEWAEGCHLEPDEEYGLAWLEATQAAREDANASERLWGRYGTEFPELPSHIERDLAGLPLDEVTPTVDHLRKYRGRGAKPTRSERLLSKVRRRVEASSRLRRMVLPVAERLGLAD